MSPIDQMLAGRTIAIVGLSDDPSRTSHQVGRYLRDAGYVVVPVNPNCGAVFGLTAVASLAALSEPPDVVLVFRRPEFCEAIAREAVAIGARGVWLQSGIISELARAICAAAASVAFVQDRCIYVEHARRAR